MSARAEERSVGLPAFNASAVDPALPQLTNLLYGPDTYWQSLLIVFTLNALRSLGTALAGYAYYFLLSAVPTGGDLRDRLDDLDFFFAEQTLSSNAAANLLVWTFVVVGRTAWTLLAHGRLPPVPPVRTLLGAVARPAQVRVFLPRFFFEWVGMHLGFLALGLVGRAAFGDAAAAAGGKRKRRKRRKREEDDPTTLYAGTSAVA